MVITSLSKMSKNESIIFAGKQFINEEMRMHGKITEDTMDRLVNFLEERFSISQTAAHRFKMKSYSAFMIAWCRKTGEPIPENVHMHVWQSLPVNDEIEKPQFKTDKIKTEKNNNKSD